MKQKQYNACFRLRKKRFTIHTKAKVIIVNSDIEFTTLPIVAVALIFITLLM